METISPASPETVLERLHTALIHHDLAAFVACFAPDYQSVQPLHPGVAFTGREQVEKNWGAIFGHVPDFRPELLQSAIVDDKVWAEWHWYGTRGDGTPFEFCGITLFGVQDGQIVWGRLYMEPVQAPSTGIDALVHSRTHGSP